MNKQTAVEWLVKQLTKTINYDDSANAEDLRIKLYSLIINIEKQAKAMERQQIMKAYGQGIADEAGEILDATKDAEQYYNETYTND